VRVGEAMRWDSAAVRIGASGSQCSKQWSPQHGKCSSNLARGLCSATQHGLHASRDSKRWVPKCEVCAHLGGCRRPHVLAEQRSQGGRTLSCAASHLFGVCTAMQVGAAEDALRCGCQCRQRLEETRMRAVLAAAQRQLSLCQAVHSQGAEEDCLSAQPLQYGRNVSAGRATYHRG
jgi:hypothetical protein